MTICGANRIGKSLILNELAHGSRHPLTPLCRAIPSHCGHARPGDAVARLLLLAEGFPTAPACERVNPRFKRLRAARADHFPVSVLVCYLPPFWARPTRTTKIRRDVVTRET